MKKVEQKRVKELIDRIGRISAADEWAEELNPTQRTALSYLARANRFSRSPSQVADFMAATRGTVSQTLKALAKKELIAEVRSDRDKRSISYSVTKQGVSVLQKHNVLDDTLNRLDDDDSSALLAGLEKLLRDALELRGLRAFGICRTCSHHAKTNRGRFCELLNQPLSAADSKQICHEHSGDA